VKRHGNFRGNSDCVTSGQPPHRIAEECPGCVDEFHMTNILESLIDLLENHLEKHHSERQIIAVGLATHFLILVFGLEWVQRHISFRSSDPDEWMMNGDDAWLAAHPVENDFRRILHDHRTVRLADAMFTLLVNKVTGIDALRHRFRSNDMRSCFVEAEIASMLSCKNDFSVEIVEESGVKGRDFDLVVKSGGQEISVEITCKIPEIPTESTVVNTLNQKRKQVPANRPAVLYMRVPSEWMRESNIYDTLTRAIVKFAKRSQRFNAIILVWEDVTPFQTGALTAMSMRPCFMNQARLPLAERWEPAIGHDGKGKVAESLLERIEAHRARKRASA
jgi:hypothetical protein